MIFVVSVPIASLEGMHSTLLDFKSYFLRERALLPCRES